jgi:hypothetical protein
MAMAAMAMRRGRLMTGAPNPEEAFSDGPVARRTHSADDKELKAIAKVVGRTL